MGGSQGAGEPGRQGCARKNKRHACILAVHSSGSGPWLPGSLAPWLPGSLAPWLPSSLSSILALDQGTTSSRALVVHQDGTVLGSGQRPFRQHYPEPGWVDHDAEELVETTLAAAQEALAASRERGL